MGCGKLLAGLLVAGLLFGAGPTPAADHSGPSWAFDPGAPGPDRPPVGRSLFDWLMAVERDGRTEIQVPFPFSALRARLLRDQADDGALKQVLIPLGRALQRRAAAPDFFGSPRIVVAFDGDGGGLRLKDRLYIGYQERAESLEVISYNEAAGRFEFQLVQDYAPGKTPRLVYADRRLCVSCHQNGGPIFSQPLWRETNANPDIAQRLVAAAPSFHGIDPAPAHLAAEQAMAIGEAAGRANLIGAAQAAWDRACGATEDPRACRASLLRAAWLDRLSGARRLTAGAPDGLDDQLAAAWPRLWPAGLAIAVAQIADRDPLDPAAGREADGTDPLMARPPLEVWHSPAMAEIVATLAGFITEDEVRRLDRRLIALRPATAGRTEHQVPCALSRRRHDGFADRYALACEPAGPAGLGLNGYFSPTAEGPVTGSLLRLQLGGLLFEDLALSAAELTANRVQLRPRERRRQLSPRLPDGRAVESLVLEWDRLIEEDYGPSEEIPVYPANARITVTLVDDGAPLVAAIVDLAAEAGPSDLLLAEGPFRGGALTGALFEILGLDPGPDCCLDPAGLPPPQIAATPAQLASGTTERGFFTLYCASCHASPDPFPPNFLYRAAEADGLAQCGERIAYRLAQWDLPTAERRLAPMPPESWLKGAGLSAEAWRASPALAALRRQVPALPEAADYDALKPCLALR